MKMQYKTDQEEAKQNNLQNWRFESDYFKKAYEMCVV